MKRFNIRVYALIFNDKNEILLSEEIHRDKYMLKFPGGGMEWGESPLECLKRELFEELNLDLVRHELFYLTDFFQVSYFNPNDQVVAIYFQCEVNGKPVSNEANVSFVWKDLANLSPEEITFPIDRHVLSRIKVERNM